MHMYAYVYINVDMSIYLSIDLSIYLGFDVRRHRASHDHIM